MLGVKVRCSMSFPIRAKLTLLVGLPVLLVGLTIPILSDAEHRDLTDAADDHVEDAQRAFVAEVEDDLHRLEAIADTIADARLTVRGLKDGNQSDVLRVLQRFAKFYPRLDFIAAAGDGRVIANLGPSQKLENIREISELSELAEFSAPHILLAHATYQETKDIIEARPVAELTVKGRTEPVVTYALMGLRVEA